MSLHSTVSVAKVGTNSLRATIPEGIVAYLDVQAGDKLEWKMEVIDGEKIVLVEKGEVLDSKARKLSTKYVRSDKRRKQK